MRSTYTVEGVGKVTITDKDFLASGGEAQVFVKDDTAYKIYHDQKTVIPVNKIKELQAITASNVLKPMHIIYDASGSPVGYSMDFKKNSVPVCKLFTKAFKTRSNISNEMITSFIEKMQDTISSSIHPSGCLIVDLNELNVLASSSFKIPFFIDVDSFQTPSFHATAIMESIRDRLIKNNKWTQESDWYSFAIMSFQLWIGIHPYKGSHPDYKPNDWIKRMEDGVSVFDKKASIPAICNDFSVIPPSHLAWFKEIFLKNGRCKPPSIGDMVAIISVPTSFNVISSSDMFTLGDIETCIERIVDVFNYMGINYSIGSKNIYKGKSVLPIDIDGFNKIVMCESESSPIICKLKDEIMYVEDEKGNKIGNIAATDMMYRNGCVYTVKNGRLTENSFVQFGNKIIHANRMAGNVLDLATQVFDGVIFQDLLGKMHITLPYEKGKCATLPVKELDGFRILDARSERNVCGIMAEKKGIYYCFVLTFNPSYNQYTIRTKKNVSYCEINLTVLPNGISVMANDSEVEIFKENDVKVISNPPFNSTTKLFNYSGGIFYIDGKKIVSAKTKK